MWSGGNGCLSSAGARVQEAILPLLCVGSSFQRGWLDECANQYPKVFSSFAVTRSKHKSEQSDQVQPSQKLFFQVDESSRGKKQFVSYPVTIAI